MQLRIKSIRLKNFKCFGGSKYYEFSLDDSKNPIILTGPNGFGKTTFFDAIEIIFSKKITRFDTSIENKSTDLQKNVLLNAANVDGYIVCTLINENRECLSIIARIDHSMHKVSYIDSIHYGVIPGNIPSEELDITISNYSDWRNSVDEFEKIRYSRENFNVYYYVSQAESVHFLKQSITARKNTMDALLDLENVDNWANFLQDKLIGKNVSSSNVLINDQIKAVDEIINTDIFRIKELNNTSNNLIAPNFEHIMECDREELYPEWDCENLGKVTQADLEKGLNDIDKLSKLVGDYADFKRYLWNEKIDSATSKGIDDYLVSHQYISNDKLNLCIIENDIAAKNNIVEAFNNSVFLRDKDINPDHYSIDGMTKLKAIFPECVLFDIKEVGDTCDLLKTIKKTLSFKQDVLNKLEIARSELKEVSHNYDGGSDRCPYCGHSYGESQKLEEAYEAAHSLLEAENGEELKKYNAVKEKLQELLKQSQSVLREKIGEYDKESIHTLLTVISKLSSLISDKKRVGDVEILSPFFTIDAAFEKMGAEEQKNELSRMVIASKQSYKNEEFTNNNTRYDYQQILSQYPEIEWKKQKLLLETKRIEDKKAYIKAAINAHNNKEMKKIKDHLSENVRKWERLKVLRDDLKAIQKIYSDSIDTYKNQVIKKLRVPLLIYTGKILQDYQNGLGVFISKNEMRFVTNGDVKHDILNTFSSGQLSGFVLAFLFSMNKQYVKESEDDLGFILIDDPVQTMDDINISSMIEVLRNDFKDKQIILSTHEIDKENYILYKFFKYNRIGQSFNVKDRLYGV